MDVCFYCFDVEDMVKFYVVSISYFIIEKYILVIILFDCY